MFCFRTTIFEKDDIDSSESTVMQYLYQDEQWSKERRTTTIHPSLYVQIMMFLCVESSSIQIFFTVWKKYLRYFYFFQGFHYRVRGVSNGTSVHSLFWGCSSRKIGATPREVWSSVWLRCWPCFLVPLLLLLRLLISYLNLLHRPRGRILVLFTWIIQ